MMKLEIGLGYMARHHIGTEERGLAVTVQKNCIGVTALAPDRQRDRASPARFGGRPIFTAAALGAALSLSSGITNSDASAPRVELPASHLTDNSIGDNVAELYRELSDYQSLSSGWDGLGSISPNEETINQAREFLDTLLSFGLHLRLPDVATSADGDIDLYWQVRGSFIDINFTGSHLFSYYARIKGEVVAKDLALYSKGSIPKELYDAI